MGRAKGEKGAAKKEEVEVEPAAAAPAADEQEGGAEAPQAKRAKKAAAADDGAAAGGEGVAPAVVLVPVPVMVAVPHNLSAQGAVPEQPGLVAAQAGSQTQLIMHTTGAGSTVLAVRSPRAPHARTHGRSAARGNTRSPGRQPTRRAAHAAHLQLPTAVLRARDRRGRFLRRRAQTLKVPASFIGSVIGKGGASIRRAPAPLAAAGAQTTPTQT